MNFKSIRSILNIMYCLTLKDPEYYDKFIWTLCKVWWNLHKPRTTTVSEEKYTTVSKPAEAMSSAKDKQMCKMFSISARQITKLHNFWLDYVVLPCMKKYIF